MYQATAYANANIALIKYWGKADGPFNIPAVSSLSVTLDALGTTTTVELSVRDELFLNDQPTSLDDTVRLGHFLNIFRKRFDVKDALRVVSHNSIPTASGLASSASAYAALAVALNELFSLNLSERDLSIVARRGSASAARSIFGGFAILHGGAHLTDDQACGEKVADGNWANLELLIVMVSDQKKPTSSRQAMDLSKKTSPYYASWVDTHETDFLSSLNAVAINHFERLGQLMEHSTLKMHAVMWASSPPINYFLPKTLEVMAAVYQIRERFGPIAFFTMDAGPNVKVLCQSEHVALIKSELIRALGTANILSSKLGQKARVL